MTNTNTPHCGDNCGFVHTQNALYGDRLLPEEKMQLAVKGVQGGQFSQRGAAKEFGVAQKSLSRRLQQVSQVTHPETSQSEPAVQPMATDGQLMEKLTSNERQKALRQLCKQHGLTAGKAGNQGLYDLLQDNHVVVPDHLTTPTLRNNYSPKTDEPNEQELQVNNSLSLVPDGAEQADTYIDSFEDFDAVRDEVCQQVQKSDRPADFKRAILLLTELDAICTDAWYSRNPKLWDGEEWTHVSSEIEIIRDLVHQRAQEACTLAVSKRNAFNVEARVVA